MDASGATAVVLPELMALEGVEQSRFHHLDVYGHTRAVLAETIALERDPSILCDSEEELEALRRVLQAPLANELTRGQALRFGALLHDIAKPQTRDVTAQGRITFMGHDEAGAPRSSVGRPRSCGRAERLRGDTWRRSPAITCGSASSCTRCRWAAARCTTTCTPALRWAWT